MSVNNPKYPIKKNNHLIILKSLNYLTKNVNYLSLEKFKKLGKNCIIFGILNFFCKFHIVKEST